MRRETLRCGASRISRRWNVESLAMQATIRCVASINSRRSTWIGPHLAPKPTPVNSEARSGSFLQCHVKSWWGVRARGHWLAFPTTEFRACPTHKDFVGF